MAYATQDDLVPRRMTAQDLEQLTDDSNAGQINAQTVSDILAEASGTIDAYCRQRYTVPLQLSEQVKGLTLDVAVYLLFSRRNRVAESVAQRYKDAIAFLRDVGAGKASLDQPAGAAPQSGGGAAVVTEQEEKFSDENLEGFI